MSQEPQRDPHKEQFRPIVRGVIDELIWRGSNFRGKEISDEERDKLATCCLYSSSGILESGAAQEVSPLTPYGELMQRVDDYRSGYSCGYSDAKNGTRMRDKDAAQLFFRIDDGIPDVSEYQLNQEEVSPPSPDKFKSALELIENYDSSCECDDHSQPECCANVSVSDCFCAHCIAGKALL